MYMKTEETQNLLEDNTTEEPQENKSAIDNDMLDLYDILSYQREASSDMERLFISKYIIPIPNIIRDTYGNYYVKIFNEDGTDPVVLYSCHIDTVHNTANKQKLFITDKGIIYCQPSSEKVNDKGIKITTYPNCLGADDGAGIWIMLRLIKANKPGLYIFHRDEESGRKGSIWISNHNKEILEGIKFALAFDRRDVNSVITHQGMRTCSDKFADSLIEALGIDTLKKDPTGSFTDTRSYIDIIPECTNISAGYYNAHTSKESLDSVYLKNLLEKMLALDVSKLVVDRDPKAKPEYNHTNTYYSNYHSSYGNSNSKIDWNKVKYRNLIRNNIDIIIDMLEETGITQEEITMYVASEGGFLPSDYGYGNWE